MKLIRHYAVKLPKWQNNGIIICYHRIHSITNIHHIVYHKFDLDTKRNGQLYGPGYYASYTLAAQQTKYMRKNYGNYLLRSAIDISKHLVLDAAIQKKLGLPDIATQLINAGFKKSHPRRGNSVVFTMIDYYNFSFKAGRLLYTSDLAKYLASNYLEQIKTKFTGMVYTGAQDGTTIVTYDMTKVQFIDYARYNAQDINHGYQPNWKSWPSEFVAIDGQSFADRLIQRAQQQKNVAKATQQFSRAVRQLKLRERRFVLQRLSQQNAKFNQRLTFLDWVATSSPESNQWFAELFGSAIGHAPKFAYTLNGLINRPNLRNLASYGRQYGAMQRVLLNNVTFWQTKSLYNIKIRHKVAWLLVDDFMLDWRQGISQFITEAPLQSDRIAMARFIHRLSILHTCWLDFADGTFNNGLFQVAGFFDNTNHAITNILIDLDEIKQFMRHKLRNKPYIRKQLKLD